MKSPEMTAKTSNSWLVLIHQIPPKPAYFRVKVGRRLQRLGSVAIKNSVYALPLSDGATEDLQWILKEIVQEGGEASLCEARFIEGLSDQQIQSLFQEARNADYRELEDEVRKVAQELPTGTEIEPTARAELEGHTSRFRRRFAEVNAIDFFGAERRETVDGLIASLEAQLKPPVNLRASAHSNTKADDYSGRTWVTRQGIHVDRMASAWLIQRFIDKTATFKFVPSKGYKPEAKELRFDMFETEFTHEGDCCTFEVLIKRFELGDPALRPLAEIIHDIDLKDSKFGRQDALGFERLIAGIAMAHKEDTTRLERACAVLDDLYQYFKLKPEKEPSL